MDDLRFTWNPRKARANEQKHGISFEEGATVFFDEEALLLGDPDHSIDEDRFLLLGLSSQLRLLTICHCARDDERTIRLISARRATKREQEQYVSRYRR